PALEGAARGIAEDERPGTRGRRPVAMNRVNAFRLLVVVAAIAALEALCLAGLIDKITMQPPHLIARDLYRLLVSGRMNGAIAKMLTNTVLSLVLALGLCLI